MLLNKSISFLNIQSITTVIKSHFIIHKRMLIWSWDTYLDTQGLLASWLTPPAVLKHRHTQDSVTPGLPLQFITYPKLTFYIFPPWYWYSTFMNFHISFLNYTIQKQNAMLLFILNITLLMISKYCPNMFCCPAHIPSSPFAFLSWAVLASSGAVRTCMQYL